MKLVSLLLAFSVLICGCARKSEMEAARTSLAEAQRRIEALENERVSKTQSASAQEQLKLASERITQLENELQLARAQTAALANTPAGGQSTPNSTSSTPLAAPSHSPEPPPAALGLTHGTYVVSNDTYVYTEDSQLAFGDHLQISSPTGLMVSDPELKIVGGDLAIKAKGVTMETNDGLLTTGADGSVKFTGKNLTMKFDDAKPSPIETSGTSPTSNTPPTDAPTTPSPKAP